MTNHLMTNTSWLKGHATMDKLGMSRWLAPLAPILQGRGTSLFHQVPDHHRAGKAETEDEGMGWYGVNTWACNSSLSLELTIASSSSSDTNAEKVVCCWHTRWLLSRRKRGVRHTPSSSPTETSAHSPSRRLARQQLHSPSSHRFMLELRLWHR